MTTLAELLPVSWQAPLGAELAKPYIAELEAFLASERAAHQVFPPPQDVFRALALTPFDNVRAVILGQDPYHDDGQAHGLAFSVAPGVKPPPSLVNMFKELETDLGLPRPTTGFLEPWAKQGVLLLNTVLTVRAHAAASHQKQGWEAFTDAVIRSIAERDAPAVFVLWGAHAQKKLRLIAGTFSSPVSPKASLRLDAGEVPRRGGGGCPIASTLDSPPSGAPRHLPHKGGGEKTPHTIIQSAHPSPLSARNGFFGSKPFSRINAALHEMGHAPIDWDLS